MNEQNVQTLCQNASCARPIEAAWGHCPYCGAGQSVQPATVQPAPLRPMQTLQCPRCGSADAQKVSAIYSAGTWQGTSVASTHGTGYNSQGGHISMDALTVGVSRGQTHLAARLQPPIPPRSNTYTPGLRVFYGVLLGLIWSYAIVAALACLVLLPAGSGDRSGIAFGAIGASLLGYWLARGYVRWQQEGQDTALHQLRQAQYAAATEQWQNAYYCFRCDSIFALTARR